MPATWNDDKESAPLDGKWILVCKYLGGNPFTVRYITPFTADPSLADWRDEHGKVRTWRYWRPIG